MATKSINSLSMAGNTGVFTLPSGTCTTAGSTAAKAVTVNSSFSLEDGVMIAVRFANTNSASNITLNVNDSGAKSITRRGSAVGPGPIRAFEVILLRYFKSGSTEYWEMVECIPDKADLGIGASDVGAVPNTRDGVNAAINLLPPWTATPTDDTQFICQDTGLTNVYGLRKTSTIFNYVKSKLPAWATASTKPTYTKSEIGLGNVDNTADADKSVKYATSAGNSAKLGGVDALDYRKLTESQFYGSEVASNYWVGRATTGGGGWDFSPIRVYAGDKTTRMMMVGIRGGEGELHYIYIGNGTYESLDNLRIYPDGKVTAKTFEGALSGNAATATKVSNALKINSYTGTVTNYDGSAAVTLDVATMNDITEAVDAIFD